MTIDLPKAHEVPGAVAQAMLGYNNLASVRKLLALGRIAARKINRDLWYDRTTIEAYLETRQPPGRPVDSIPARRKPRSKKGILAEQVREQNRLYQRERRARMRAETEATQKADKKRAGKSGKK